ncbi:MAG TPA: GNAT family N-acetyltransferase [Candidatus Eremiobacteraceae bacterium]|nr:GNAT family N-acetyltransferase [Candidatus Eremiobacteraceae bacterium]
MEQLETERLVLEPIGPSHARTLFPLVSHVRLFTYVDQDPPASEQALEMRYRGWSTGLSPDRSERWLNWAARLRGTEVYVGWFQATVRADRTAEIAYVTFVDHQRCGYAKEATTAVMAHLVRSYLVTSIVATVDPRNSASIALANSLGMQQVSGAGKDLRFAVDAKRDA